ncbi:MAG: hypothetical protein V3U16_04855 [Candidatus Neomarinimicrobiota bacterium]
MKFSNQKISIILIAFLVVIGLFFRSLGKSAGPLSKQTRSLLFESKAPGIPGSHLSSNADLNIEESIHSAANYLIRLCDNEGRFTYRINTSPDVKVSRRYNMLRHAGTLYALAAFALEYNNVRARETVLSGSRFLKQQLDDLSSDGQLLAVLSNPAINGGKDRLQAKLGGTGLGLVALCYAEKLHPRTTSIDTLRKMGNFIVTMQKEDGSFFSKYFPNGTGRDDSWTSLYYPGEAILGLLLLYELDQDPLWLEAAQNGLLFLADLRSKKTKVEADHWALIATDKLFRINPTLADHIRKKINRHAFQICFQIMNTKPVYEQDHPYHGCFSRDGRTTPTATRLEGLLAVFPYLSKNETSLSVDIKNSMGNSIDFLMRSQLQSGLYTGGIPRAISSLKEDHHSYSKSFNRRSTEIRIDYVQHALSALMAFRMLVSKGIL